MATDKARAKAAIAALMLLAATPAAAWEVTRERDRMSDKTLTWASARSNGATLLVGCLNGRAEPRLTWPKRIGFGSGVGVSWRVDEGPVQSYLAGMFSQDGTVFYPWTSAHAGPVMRAKRVRVSIGKAFFDFDLVKGEALPKVWGC